MSTSTIELCFSKTPRQLKILFVDNVASIVLLFIRLLTGNFFFRHIYGQKVEFRTYDHALATIYAANKYLCPELVKCCVIYLDKEINDETVMFIYRQLRLFASTFAEISPDNPFAFSSAPPAEDVGGAQAVDDQRERSGEMMTTYCTSLLYNCYHYVDTSAEGLLKSDALEDLDHDQLLDIVKRDRLRKYRPPSAIYQSV